MRLYLASDLNNLESGGRCFFCVWYDSHIAVREMVNFVALGLPSPGGSKSAFRNPRTGRIVVVDAGGKKTKQWRNVVATAAREAMVGMELLKPPLSLIVEFRMPRPKSHFKSNGEIKADAPYYPIVRPDVTKLLRSTEDAMTGIIYHDDAHIVEQIIHRTYSHDEDIGARITVLTLAWRQRSAKTPTNMQEWDEGKQSLHDIDTFDKTRRSSVEISTSPPVHR